MIAQLTIRNFALIDELSLEFAPGLNVLTGETGAGKSILIGALRYALGERFDTGQMRDAGKPCVVELVLELPAGLIKDNECLREYFEGKESQAIINRTYTPDGRNKIKFNGFSLTLSQLKAIGDILVDFHGPNDHQMLLDRSSHIKMLDRLSAPAAACKEAYLGLYREYVSLTRSIREVEEGALSRQRDMDLLGHQIKELSRVSLDKKKFDETVAKEAQIRNLEKLSENIAALIGIFENEDTGISETVSKAFPYIKTLSSMDKNAAQLEEQMDRMQALSDDITSALRKYEDDLSFEPDEAGELAARCDAYHDIIRKYGPAIEDAAAFYKKAKERYDFLTNLEHNDGELRCALAKCSKSMKDEAAKITGERRKAASALASVIEKELKDLSIAHVKFECRVAPSQPGPDGADDVTFYISANLGEELKPLSEIISSGEAARVMLALKKSLTKVDPVPVLIFDEIDAQIGGRLGSVIGAKLRELSAGRQVILITHLPQIAGYAVRHFKVLKKALGGRAVTTIEILDKQGRVKEMAQMMSGEKESAVSVTHAEEMLKQSAKGK